VGDVEKFVALPDVTGVEWHRSGWLALIHQHLMSLGRFNDLTRRQAERNATVRTPDGREFNLNGFQVVDVEKFVALPEATVIEWHRSGWLALIHQHLMSLGRFNDLTRRQVERLAA